LRRRAQHGSGERVPAAARNLRTTPGWACARIQDPGGSRKLSSHAFCAQAVHAHHCLEHIIPHFTTYHNSYGEKDQLALARGLALLAGATASQQLGEQVQHLAWEQVQHLAQGSTSLSRSLPSRTTAGRCLAPRRSRTGSGSPSLPRPWCTCRVRQSRRRCTSPTDRPTAQAPAA